MVDDLQFELYSLRATLCHKQGLANWARRWTDKLKEAADNGQTYAAACLTEYYMNTRHYADAIPLLKAEVERQNRTNRFDQALLQDCRQLVTALRSVGRQEEAWQYADRATQIADTLNSRNNRNEILQTTALYENKEKAARIASQQKELAQQHTINLTLTALVAALVTAIFLAYHTLRKTHRHNLAMAQRIHEEMENNRRMAQRIDNPANGTTNTPAEHPTDTPADHPTETHAKRRNGRELFE